MKFKGEYLKLLLVATKELIGCPAFIYVYRCNYR